MPVPVCAGLLSAHLCSIDDAHVHASFAGMVQEGAVEAASHRLIASEGEGNVGDPSTDLAARALPLDLPGSADEVHSIVVVLRHAGANSEDVGVKNDVFRVKAHLLHQDLKGSGADAHLVLSSGRLHIANCLLKTTSRCICRMTTVRSCSKNWTVQVSTYAEEHQQ